MINRKGLGLTMIIMMLVKMKLWEQWTDNYN